MLSFFVKTTILVPGAVLHLTEDMRQLYLLWTLENIEMAPQQYIRWQQLPQTH